MNFEVKQKSSMRQKQQSSRKSIQLNKQIARGKKASTNNKRETSLTASEKQGNYKNENRNQKKKDC